jgi:signal transduction histidine kinase
VASERARFRYRLLGANRDWREETSERTARYINLKPGKYRFEVTAADHHGIWNPVPASFGFSLVPRFWQTWTFYVLCGSGVIGLAAGLQAYRLRWQRRLLKLEEQRALATERTRIARDLHDDLGTALTGLALELDVAGRQAKEVAPLAGRLSEAAQRTRDLAERMREVVWTVNPKCDTVSSLASFLEQQVSQFLRADGLRLRLDFPEDIPELPLGAEARHELALSVREALTNVVRHAQATEVTLSLAITDQTLRVQVKDNGRGFRQCQTNAHGLANMKARMERVRGSFECLCAPDGGTAVTFRLPLGQPAKQLAPNEA